MPGNNMVKIKRKFVHLYNYIDEFFILPVWGAVGRVTFGNNAGIFNNLFPKLELSRLQRLSKIQRDSDSLSEKFINDGYVALKSEFDPALMVKIKTKLERLFEDPNAYIAAGHPPHQDAHRILKDPLTQVPELKQLHTDRINRLVKNYYGSYYQIENIQCWRNMYVGGVGQKKNVFSNQWHNDQFTINLLKHFVYLNEKVTEESGAFRVHSRKNTKIIMRSLGYIRRSHIYGKAKRMINSPEFVDVIEGQLGDGFMFNPTICLHRAGVPKENTYRDVIQFEFKPSDHPFENKNLELNEVAAVQQMK
jgi:hypothetical protein